MTKQLTLMRHAKSSWDDASLSDFDRPLNARGFKNAPEMGERLAETDFLPDIIITSPAIRAKTTAELIAEQIKFNKNQILQEPAIYEAGIQSLVNVVAGIDDEHQHAMLVGHNPGFTYVCNYLSDASIDNIPTCGIVHIEFDVSTWQNIDESSGKLIDFDYPKK